ncbi:MAG: HAMP domain-containing protein [Planctomycetes bacterium]|nr:HAMP domain-containing protein [Planctomycetota bacterium]
MIFRPRSIRVRLTVWYASVLAVILAAFSVAVYALVRGSLLHEVEERAQSSCAVLEGLVTDEPMDPDEIEEHAIVTLFALEQEGVPTHVSAGWTQHGLPPPAHFAGGLGARRWVSQSGSVFSIARATTEGSHPLAILVAIDETPAREHLRTLALVLLLGFPVAIAAAIVGGSLLAKRALAPVGAMAEAAARITTDRLSDRLPIENPDDEFGRLAAVFNQTLARLQDGFERLRRFTADASHELRTPLTALRSVGEVALRSPDFHDRCRDTVASMLEESARLTELVDGLLTLTRESTQAFRARFAPVDLAQLAREVAELFKPLAEERGQRLDTRIEATALIRSDRSTVRQALVNLVDNALAYTPRGGSIRIQVGGDDGEIVVAVVDDGPGIAAEHHARIFERFYRVDPARARSHGGAGLGLAIARWAVELNDGRIELDSHPGAGSTFRIVWSRAPGAGTATVTHESPHSTAGGPP